MVYDYNEDGELISESRTDGSGQSKTNVFSATQRLTEQQITENSQPVSAFGYTYDAGGNITSATQNGQTDTYTYTSANRIETYNGQAVQHDGDGNITVATIDGVLTDYTFDVRNRLTSAGDLTFEYDLENRRIQKQGGSQTTTYVQNPNAPLPQVLMKTTGGTTTYYIYGQGLIAEETGTAYRTYHYDYRGSTIALTDSNGLVSDTYAYGPYGELLNHTGTSQVDYLYNGRDGVITDSEDLYYMRARYYSTDLKRFLSEDAFSGKYDNLLGLNLYGYVSGNPVQYVDPSGYFTEQYPGGGGAAGIAGIYITKLLNSPDLYNDLNLAASDYANKDYPALTGDLISALLAGVDAGTIKLGGKSVTELVEAFLKNSNDLPAGLRKLFESGLNPDFGKKWSMYLEMLQVQNIILIDQLH